MYLVTSEFSFSVNTFRRNQKSSCKKYLSFVIRPGFRVLCSLAKASSKLRDIDHRICCNDRNDGVDDDAEAAS